MKFEDEIAELRKEFRKVDQTDPEALRQWFETHSYLKTTDIAIIAERNINYVRDLKKRAGLGKGPIKMPPPQGKKMASITVPEDWDNEWLAKALQLYSIRAIAKATGVPRSTIFSRKKKIAKEARSHKEAMRSNNPFCTKAWVYEHYVTQGLSQKKCAELAGIAITTFTKWLVRFEIPVRTSRESIIDKRDIKIWCRELLKKLRDQPIVRKCFLRQDHIHVRFYDYYWETYYPDKSVRRGPTRIPRSFTITKDQAKLEHVPQVIKQYESGFDPDAYKAHIVIPMAQWKEASFIEQRLCVHEFARQIVTRGWLDPNYPAAVLEAEWDKLCNLNPARYLRNSTFNAFPNTNRQAIVGRRLVEHFFDLSELWEIIKSPRWTIQALNFMVTQDLNVYDTHNFYRCVMKVTPKDKPRMIDPGFYSILLKRLGIRGKVLDLTPNCGNRAIACAINGLTYVTLPNQKIRKALERGVADYVGLDYEEYDGGVVDLVLMENDLRKCDIDEAMKYASKAKRMLVFTPRQEKSKIQAKYNPSSMISVKARCFGSTTDFISLW